MDLNEYLRTHKLPNANTKVGFDRGYQIDAIIGAGRVAGTVYFLIKWKGRDETELVEAKICNKRCAQEVINFYEGRVHWASDTDSSSADEMEDHKNLAV